MIRILCYGDSNTWGADPVTQDRYPWDTRWPGVLRASLNQDYEVLEEGMSGRTTVLDDPLEPGRNGLTYLQPCLESHRPLDLVILMLGTNDLKTRFNLPAVDIAKGIRRLAITVQRSAAGRSGAAPKMLLVCPPPVLEMGANSDSFAGAAAKSQQLDIHYAAAAKELGLEYLNAGSVITSSRVDGIHLDASEHRKLGLELASRVIGLIKK